MNTKNLVPVLAIVALLSISGLYLFRQAKQKSVTKKEMVGSLIIGTNAEFPPFAFMQNNEIVGFDIDIIKEVVKRIGKKMELKDMPFDALIPDIQLGNVHMIAAGMTATPEREERVLFTKPYFTGDPLLIVTLKKNNQVKNLDDLLGKEVAVNEGYTSDFYMSGIPGMQLLRLPSPAEAFLALESNRAFAFVTSKTSAQPFFDKYGKDKFHAVPLTGTAEPISLAISKKYPELLPQVQSALDEMEKDGTIKKLKTKWNM